MDNNEAITAVSRQAKTMVDGSLRLTIEFDERHAKAAFAQFGSPGQELAIVALIPGASLIKQPSASDAPKGGPYARLAGQWCKSVTFWAWLSDAFDAQVYSEVAAASVVRGQCGVNSRAELDSDARAQGLFDLRIRAPFAEWMRANKVTL